MRLIGEIRNRRLLETRTVADEVLAGKLRCAIADRPRGVRCVKLGLFFYTVQSEIERLRVWGCDVTRVLGLEWI